jgi:hypothetical protein
MSKMTGLFGDVPVLVNLNADGVPGGVHQAAGAGRIPIIIGIQNGGRSKVLASVSNAALFP